MDKESTNLPDCTSMFAELIISGKDDDSAVADLDTPVSDGENLDIDLDISDSTNTNAMNEDTNITVDSLRKDITVPVTRIYQGTEYQHQSISSGENNYSTLDATVLNQDQQFKADKNLFNMLLSQPSVEMDGGEISNPIKVACCRFKDFVILHASEDAEAAYRYRDHLLQEFPDLTPPLEVDMFIDIDSNRTHMDSISALHDKYHYFLIYVTRNLARDKLAKYLNEMLITSGLNEEHKSNRVIPVWAIDDTDKILFGELMVIKGFQYSYVLLKDDSKLQDMYKRSVMATVKHARAKVAQSKN